MCTRRLFAIARPCDSLRSLCLDLLTRQSADVSGVYGGCAEPVTANFEMSDDVARRIIPMVIIVALGA